MSLGRHSLVPRPRPPQLDVRTQLALHEPSANILSRPIAFHPASVIFDTPNHSALIEKVGVKDMVNGVLDEMLQLADANGCKFPPTFKNSVIDDMTRPNAPESIMWQDYMARRPMEVETYLGSPIKLARDSSIAVPRIETLYAILHNLNIVNRSRPKGMDGAGMHPPSSPTIASPLPRMPSQTGHRPIMGMPPGAGPMPPRQPRPRNSSNFNQPPGMRRGPPPAMGGGPPNGYSRPPSHMNGGGSRAASRRGSMDGNDLEEFSHLMLYDGIPEGGEPTRPMDPQDIAMRERELQLRQRELAMREQEMRSRRGPPPVGPQRRGPHPMRNSQQVFDDDDDDDGYDPMPTGAPTIDPDNFDMMSVTSRKNRKAAPPSAMQIRQNPEVNGAAMRGSRFRPSFGRNRSSHGPPPVTGAVSGVPDNFLDDPLMNSTSNRYGTVDRGAMGAGSRANSLTASRLDEMQFGPGPGGPPGMNGAYPRRASQSPGNPYSPSIRGGSGRPSPPNGYGPPLSGRPSPPESVRQPVPRYPPGQGNAIAPQQVEQQIGVSSLHPPKSRNVGSLTGSASASAGSGEASSEPSAHSSQSSFQQPQQPTVGVR